MPAASAQGHQRGMHQQEDGHKGPHSTMERKGDIEAEGSFHPFEPAGQDHLQEHDGKGQLGEAAAEIIEIYVLSLEVKCRYPQKGQQQNCQVKDDPGQCGPQKWDLSIGLEAHPGKQEPLILTSGYLPTRKEYWYYP